MQSEGLVAAQRKASATTDSLRTQPQGLPEPAVGTLVAGLGTPYFLDYRTVSVRYRYPISLFLLGTPRLASYYRQPLLCL